MKTTFTFLVAFLFLAVGTVRAQEPEKKELKPALLVIDVQNKYMDYMSDKDLKLAPEFINAAIWLFRQHDRPVIRVYHTDPNWGPEPGSKDFAFPEDIQVEESDPKVIKNFPSAFTKTNLDSLLTALECNTLFLCGLSATGCVLATYFGGLDKEYDVFMIKNCLMSSDAELTRAVEEITEAIPWDAMKLLLEK